MQTLNHIVIFTGNLDFNARWNIAVLSEEFKDTTFTLFIHKPKKKIKQLFYNQFRNLRRHGWRWVPYQAEEIVSIVINKFKSAPLKSGDRSGQAFTLEALKNNPKIAINYFSNINSIEACDLLGSLSADLGIALSAPILKKALFDIPRLGTINLHKGRLPDYRGMPPAFWELKNNETSVGCTIHKVESGLDTGDILLEKALPIDKYSTPKGMQLKLHHCGVNMVVEAVRLIAAGEAVFSKQRPGGNTNTRPSLAIEASVTKRCKNQGLADGNGVAILKNTVFFLYADVFMPFINYYHGLKGRQKIIILLYHRVSDQFRDNVTIGIEQFDQQMAYLANHFYTASLKEIVDGAIDRHSSKPIIAVSFDDGYLDNFENAAPILIKHQLPCTFFISTEKVSHNKPFDHDLRSLGFGLDNMSWDHVMTMKKWGLQFGSHTMNHVNLAEVNDEEALRELKLSMVDIQDKLKQDSVYIAFPYGRQQHINHERIQMIKDTGYAACFSAYGGFNDVDMDLFNIKRVGVNWNFSLSAFKSRLRGWDKTH